MHEAAMHKVNSFVTLTYNEAHHEPSLNYQHVQTFLRELRRKSRVRFFAAGEYGELTKRPHWHLLLFGVGFNEKYPVGKDLYGSHQLDKLWKYGFASIGEVNYTTAGYVASYCIKKATGELAKRVYKRVNLHTGEIIQVEPEMARMSLKPGIGATWFEKYWRDVYLTRDGIVRPGGTTLKAPRYYDKLLEKTNIKLLTDKQTERIENAIKRKDDNTLERLKTKEKVATAREKLKRKKL